MARFASFLLTLLVGWMLTELRSSPPRGEVVQKSSSSRSPQKPARRKTAQTAAANPDDLTIINGIGPVAAKALNELGVWTFQQLAAQNEDELVMRLPSSMGTRVEREQWIEQAKQLAKR